MTAPIKPESAIVEEQRAKIGELAEGAQRVVHRRLPHATDHHRLRDSPAAHRANPTAYLERASTREGVAMRCELRVVLVAQTNARDAVSAGANAVRNEERERAASRDESDRVIHAGWSMAAVISVPAAFTELQP
jgi:hypothetical protein